VSIKVILKRNETLARSETLAETLAKTETLAETLARTETLAETLAKTETLAETLAKTETLAETLGKKRHLDKTMRYRKTEGTPNGNLPTLVVGAEQQTNMHSEVDHRSKRMNVHCEDTLTGTTTTFLSHRAEHIVRCSKTEYHEWIKQGNHSREEQSWTGSPDSTGQRWRVICQLQSLRPWNSNVRMRKVLHACLRHAKGHIVLMISRVEHASATLTWTGYSNYPLTPYLTMTLFLLWYMRYSQPLRRRESPVVPLITKRGKLRPRGTHQRQVQETFKPRGRTRGGQVKG
jgi:hypothetical protein